MKRTVGAIACLLSLAVSGSAFQNEDISSPTLRISWDEFKTLHDKQETVVIDVRPAEAYELGHIPGARSIPLDQIAQRTEELKTIKKPIVLYCA